MTTLYRPVKIETAEQAEALPEGTVFWVQRPSGFRYAYGTVGKGGVIRTSNEPPDGDTLHALVPIEAEEERAHLYARRAHGDMYTTPPRQELPGPAHRLVTPWEEA